MSIPPITSGVNPLLSAPQNSRVPKQVLGQEDFLKLLSVQFQSQDPMKPMEDNAFIAQMAQFSSLEQAQTLTAQMTQMRTNQDLVTANTYIGREVTVQAGKNEVVKGNVEGVEIDAGVPRLMIGGVTYPLSSVLYVAPGVAVATPPTTPVTAG
jgi:flagellar basal-body rod modification protein FlgD